MKTGYFAKHGNMAGAISISRSAPKFYHGPQFKVLAPTYPMLKMQRADYNQAYKQILLRLNPKEIYDKLVVLAKGEEPILLCWERSNTWCHRRLVAEWLEKFLGIEISEVGMGRSEVIPYKELPKI